MLIGCMNPHTFNDAVCNAIQWVIYEIYSVMSSHLLCNLFTFFVLKIYSWLCFVCCVCLFTFLIHQMTLFSVQKMHFGWNVTKQQKTNNNVGDANIGMFFRLVIFMKMFITHQIISFKYSIQNTIKFLE